MRISFLERAAGKVAAPAVALTLGLIPLLRGGLPALAADPATPPAARPIRLACVGDSLTSGYKMDAPGRDAYPAQLARLLGGGWEVRAFAEPGRTALRKTERPLWKEKAFAEALAWQPDAVILCLGSNDSWPAIWNAEGAAFAKDYREMVETFAKLPTRPKIWLCLPPPLFIDNGEEQKGILTGQILPLIARVARETGAGVIDWHTLFPVAEADKFMDDKVHPRPAAALMMARQAAAALLPRPAPPGNGHPGHAH